MIFSAVDQYIRVAGVCLHGWYMRRRLEDSTKDVMKTQNETLMTRLKENANTEYGMRFKFSEIKSREDFIKIHPLTRYPHYEPYIERMRNGDKNVLTADQPILFAVTSGTSGKSSVIPMLKKQQVNFFAQGISIFYDSVRSAYPATSSLQKDMKFFYTPRQRMSDGGIPVGPNSSSPTNSKRFLNMYSTPRPGYNILTEPEALYIHLLFGVKDKNLGIIEADFASLVYAAFRSLEANWDQIVLDVENGRVSDDLNIDEKTRSELNKYMSPDPKRAKELRQARNVGLTGIVSRIWPKVNFVMTADSGTFEMYGQKLRETYCKDTPICSPLYSASEGLLGVNIWLKQRPSRYLLTPGSMFFEMIPVERCEEEQPDTLFLDQVEVDSTYELVITNASGLYRYRLGDVVKVVAFHNTCPVVEFQYRQDQFLNIRGEKTSEAAFYTALNAALKESGINMVDYCCTESCMVPTKDSKNENNELPCYHVFLELEKGEAIKNIKIDDQLKILSNVYSSFRRNESLGPVKVFVVQPGTFTALRAYMSDRTIESPNQYKTPRVLKETEAVNFIIDKIDCRVNMKYRSRVLDYLKRQIKKIYMYCGFDLNP